MADTHLPSAGRGLPPWVEAAARAADGIVHAGDLTDPALLDRLRAWAPVWAVRGNGDPPDPRLPARRLLHLGGLRVGVTHGHLGRGATTLARALSCFAPGEVDLVIFGHSHAPLWERRTGDGPRWCLNPGSPTRRRRAPTGTCAWLTVADGTPAVDWLTAPAAGA
jgi:putative phosphoesterase